MKSELRPGIGQLKKQQHRRPGKQIPVTSVRHGAPESQQKQDLTKKGKYRDPQKQDPAKKSKDKDTSDTRLPNAQRKYST